jgi:hypothetical protein
MMMFDEIDSKKLANLVGLSGTASGTALPCEGIL